MCKPRRPCLVFAIESFPPLQDATESVPVKELEREVMAVLPQPCTAFDTVDRDCASGDLGQFRAPAVQQSVRGAKLVTYSCGMSTMPIRGIAAILSERLTARAVEGGVQVCR